MVWIPKCRRKAIYEQLRQYLGSTFRDPAIQKESKVLEGHPRSDYAHKDVQGDIDENNNFISLGNCGRRFLCIGNLHVGSTNYLLKVRLIWIK
jgi:REP element-mobilizing transposase RayT